MQPLWIESPDADTTLVNPAALGEYSLYGYAITLTSGQVDSGNDFANTFPTGGGEGGGGGGGDKQPPTDMLVTTDAMSAEGGPLDGPMSWALWVILTAALIVSGAWVVRRQRFAEI
jgi:hypothetical protein